MTGERHEVTFLVGSGYVSLSSTSGPTGPSSTTSVWSVIATVCHASRAASPAISVSRSAVAITVETLDGLT